MSVKEHSHEGLTFWAIIVGLCLLQQCSGIEDNKKSIEDNNHRIEKLERRME